jgi:hypothetical protein
MTMGQGHDPRFVRPSGSIRAIDDETIRVIYESRRVTDFLLENVTVETALLSGVVIAGGLEFLAYVIEDKRRAQDAGERVFNSRTAALAATVDEDAADLWVTVQILYALTVHPENPLELANGHGDPCGMMVRVFDENFAGAAARDPIKDSTSFTLNVTLDLKERGVLRDNAHEPFGAVRRLTVGSVRRDLGRGSRLVSGAERARSISVCLVQGYLPLHQDPPVRCGILSKFRTVASRQHLCPCCALQSEPTDRARISYARNNPGKETGARFPRP